MARRESIREACKDKRGDDLKPASASNAATEVTRRRGAGRAAACCSAWSPFGVIAGVAMVASGIPPLAAMLMSLVVFAGASMVAAAQLLASGTPVAARHPRHDLHQPALHDVQRVAAPAFRGTSRSRWRLLIAYLQADNVYGLTLMRFADQPATAGGATSSSARRSSSGPAWQARGAAPASLIGAGVPASWRLEFAAPLAFIAMTIPLLRDRAMVARGDRRRRSR